MGVRLVTEGRETKKVRVGQGWIEERRNSVERLADLVQFQITKMFSLFPGGFITLDATLFLTYFCTLLEKPHNNKRNTTDKD